MNIFIVNICGALFEFNNVYKIESFHCEDERIMIYFLDEKYNKHWHWFNCSEIVSLEIFV